MHRADRIGRGKGAYQANLKLRMEVAVRCRGLARIGGMPVMCRRIELLSHKPSAFRINGDMIVNGDTIGKFLSSAGEFGSNS
ncbi:MAG: hypothetical protein KGL62_06275 [Bradyrhizobium sp.]|nr:hypothetical protein [Bradyrhizobium sp.]